MAPNNASTNRKFFDHLQPVVFRDNPILGNTSTSTEIITMSINQCGTKLVVTRTDRSIRIWKCARDRLLEPIIIEDAHVKSVECVSWDPRTEYSFATVGRDDCIKIWRGHSGTLERTIKTEKNSLILVRYSADGEIMVAVDRDSTILVFDTNGYKLITELKLHEHIYDLQWFHYAHKFFVCALHDGAVPIYELNNGELKLRTTLKGHRSSATSISISPRGNFFVVGSSEGVVSCWDCSTMYNSKVITEIDESVSHVDCSRDGTYFIANFDTGSNAIVFDTESGEKVFEIPNSMSGQVTFSKAVWFPTKTSFLHTSENGTSITLMKKAVDSRGYGGTGGGVDGPRGRRDRRYDD
ncbi:uncharacterized protein J8A68_004954 [[Candida] subhashii]|uniref:Anaphase-promoting complex subunit 4 WD40 domain-containing protein n=1 Tax=[Candida] subhashii TaxID=561895 RepID=A0A8J5QNV8_9ASCO|nr:uncharacterized protein J8A68_004954 [[Candida] subhashii]KAG7661495.1 hypothetical protein J8A68_004954 [[Candida] subhashii]